MSNEPSQSGRVIPLRPRVSPASDHARRQEAPPSSGGSLLDDLSQYERPAGHDDYRHRMVTNVVAFTFCALLILAGVWLVNKMAEIRKNQDCVLAGHRDCRPVDVPARDRW
jgi:hypothetical protein